MPVRGGGDPLAEVWFVGRDPAGELYARRETFALDSLSTGAGGFPVTLGRCRLDESGASGAVDEAWWELSWQADGEGGYGGESRLRRTEIVTTQPAIIAQGTVSVGAREMRVSSWPGHQLHAWGSRHAELSARMHCNAFPERGAYLEAVSRSYRRLGAASPTLTMGAARLAGRTFDARSSARGLVSPAAIEPDLYEFTIRGVREQLWGRVTCHPADMVGVSYRDPDGGKVFAYHADKASVDARLMRRTRRGWKLEAEVSAAGCCAYEYASRKPVAGVPVVL